MALGSAEHKMLCERFWMPGLCTRSCEIGLLQKLFKEKKYQSFSELQERADACVWGQEDQAKTQGQICYSLKNYVGWKQERDPALI